VAEYPEAGNNALTLINCAEIVMFRAKANGKNGIQYFDQPILETFLRNIQIETKLKDAILCNRFMLHYQPQFDAKTTKLRGVEALIRWQDLDGTMISPAVFIPIAEKNGTIIPIGNWVIEEGLKTYAIWRRKYNYPLILSLNISAIQYRKKDFVNNLVNVSKVYDINPSSIELEITENILIDDFDDIVYKMRALREYGFRVSLDDFGTGFSSLSYLRDLPIDTLKIDKSFIDTVTFDDASRTITASIVSMVKKLGYETVAEGVEKQDQYEYLRDIDCDTIQGFLLGKPVPSEEIEKLIIQNM
jgi:EAL domain-containing protein (putative c-di-GMP-specific phosphodiesterase class I)